MQRKVESVVSDLFAVSKMSFTMKAMHRLVSFYRQVQSNCMNIKKINAVLNQDKMIRVVLIMLVLVGDLKNII